MLLRSRKEALSDLDRGKRAPHSSGMSLDVAAQPKRDETFAEFVNRKKRESFGADGAPYAYVADIAMLRAMRTMRPIELAIGAMVRTYKNVMKNNMLGTMIRVGPKQFPTIQRVAERCAGALAVPTPTVYVANSPVLNAYTFGTDDDAFIVVHSAMVDAFSEDELAFVIGHEMGHIQNKHVVYGTVLRMLRHTASMALRWIAPAAELGLRAWYRRAEITCDRAGLLCVRDLDVASRTFVKLASGSARLANEVDVDTYVEQAREARRGIGRLAEAFSSHPYLPKRIEALRIFAESALYREATNSSRGPTQGRTMDEVDFLTSRILEVAFPDEHAHTSPTHPVTNVAGPTSNGASNGGTHV